MRKPNPKILAQMGLLLAASLFVVGCGGSSSSVAADTEDTKLVFDPAAYDAVAHPQGYKVVNVTVDGAPVVVHQWKIVYVANPIKMASTQPALGGTGYTGENPIADPYQYQTMYVSVPPAAVNDQKAPIYLLVNNSGWKPSAVSTSITEGKAFVPSSTTIPVPPALPDPPRDTDNVGTALKAGYIVVNAGTRSRELRDVNGLWVGKAPAPVVDTKAIIRYLRLNDKVMPGSAERIICTGTSGGGGLTVAVAGSGNSTDYLPLLADIGAAGISGTGSTATSTIKDDVFAGVAYCPINNFGNNDFGYEWQFNASRGLTGAEPIVDPVTKIVTGQKDKLVTGTLGAYAYADLLSPQPAASKALMALFPPYVTGLKLKDETGAAISITSVTAGGVTTWTDTLKALIAKQVKAEAERIANGTDWQPANPAVTTATTLSANDVSFTNDWLTWDLTGGAGKYVATVNVDKYIDFVAKTKALKTVVAFDACGVTGNPGFSGESTMFGTPHQIYSNFNSWTWANNHVWGDGSGFDDTSLSWDAYNTAAGSNSVKMQLKMISGLDYLTQGGSTPAPYWYVRHGGADRDESSNMQVLLYYAALNNTAVKDINFKLAWLRRHSGNYDVAEAFDWIKAKVAANPLP